jgi:hypothetical protein
VRQFSFFRFSPVRNKHIDMPHNPHPSYQPFDITVRHIDSTDDDMTTGFIYICSDQHGAPRYAGSTHDIEKRMERNQHSVNNLYSPFYRHLQEHGIEGWQIHEYAAVHYDPTRCPDALRRSEDDCIRQLRADGCQLLNKNAALRTSTQGTAQKAWREAHGQGTPDSYMAAYCREWRARKKLEREQAEEMVGAE